MSFKIALNFEDGVTQFITCFQGEKLSDAAFRSGVNIPLDCRDGACGTCKSHCESGAYSMSDYIDDALSPDELASGYVLTCKMEPTSDCVIQIPVESSICKVDNVKIQKAKISEIENISESSILLTLEGESIKKLDFLPGQYANLFTPARKEKRAYSFSSLVSGDRVSFLIRNVPNGKMSRYLTGSAQVGDVIEFQAPFGGFYLRKIERPLLFIAGGTGLAPFLAMLESAEKNQVRTPIHLLYGVTKDVDLVGVEQLDGFKTRLINFSYTSCVYDTELDNVNRGLVTDYLVPELFHDGNVDVYLCGPPGMVGAVEEYVKNKDLGFTGFRYEKFSASI